MTWAATVEKIGWVRAAAGERFDDLTLNVYPSVWPITVTDDLLGEAGKVVEEPREQLGISSFLVGDLEELAPVVQRLAE